MPQETPLPPPARRLSLWAWALMGMLALIWGGSFLSNRLALEELDVFTIVAFRVGGAALLLWPYIWLRGLGAPLPPRRLAALLVMGVLNNVIPMSLIVWGQMHIASGLAGILNASTALFGVALAALFFRDEPLGLWRGLGTLTGFFGVTLVLGPSALAALDLTALAQWALIAASFCYALSSMFARATLSGLRPEVSAAGMLTGAALVLIPLALWHDGMPAFSYQPATWGALAYLAGLSSALAYVIFYRILALAGAGNQQLVTLLVAPVAVVLGAFAYGERLGLGDLLGFGVIAFGLLLIDGRLPQALTQWAKPPPEGR